jgi:hypothetical protein
MNGPRPPPKPAIVRPAIVAISVETSNSFEMSWKAREMEDRERETRTLRDEAKSEMYHRLLLLQCRDLEGSERLKLMQRGAVSSG